MFSFFPVILSVMPGFCSVVCKCHLGLLSSHCHCSLQLLSLNCKCILQLLSCNCSATFSFYLVNVTCIFLPCVVIVGFRPLSYVYVWYSFYHVIVSVVSIFFVICNLHTLSCKCKWNLHLISLFVTFNFDIYFNCNFQQLFCNSLC